jgi:ATP-dependent Clp protease ATP-binding subunit ClpC
VFERFTERARQVVVLAQDEARGLKHNYIGTEHLLLGLLREEEGLAARVLASIGVTVDAVRAQVGQMIGEGDSVAKGQIPFTPRAKKVLELSLREALSLGHNYIGTEHVLLGVVRENRGVASRILLDLGTDAEAIRNEIVRMLGGMRGEVAHAPGWQHSPPIIVRGGGKVASTLTSGRLLVAAWLLGAATLGAGILIGWAIWS